MEKLQQSQEVLNLGKALVKLFSDRGRTDLTTSWMSHYLAELIKEAEGESDIIKKRKLQKEASKIILDLWRERKHFPHSAPLSQLKHAVAIIGALKDERNTSMPWNYYRGYENESPWGQYMFATRRAIEAIFKITVSGSIVKEIIEKEKMWLNHEVFLSEEEKKIIEYLDQLLNSSDSFINIIYTDHKAELPKEKPDKMKQVIFKLKELIAKQNVALAKLEADINKPKSKKRKNKI